MEAKVNYELRLGKELDSKNTLVPKILSLRPIFGCETKLYHSVIAKTYGGIFLLVVFFKQNCEFLVLVVAALFNKENEQVFQIE